MKSESFRLKHVEDMPREFEPDTLYVSEEYEIACHLCACGCGTPVYTPLGPAEWKFSEERTRPTLRPSIGNWTLPCRSHYWIDRGSILWATDWSEEQVEAGRNAEIARRSSYYETTRTATNLRGWLKRLWLWLLGR